MVIRSSVLLFIMVLAASGQVVTSSGSATGTGLPTAPVPVSVSIPPLTSEVSLYWLIPVISGQRCVDSTTKSDFRFITVSGMVQISSQLQDKGGVVPTSGTSLPTGIWVRILIDDVPVSPAMPLGTVYFVDSNHYTDGTHSISIDPVDAATNGENLSPRVIPFAVDNLPNFPLADMAQVFPASGLVYHQLTFSQRVAWVSYPGHVPYPAVVPLALPTGTLPVLTPEQKRDPANWIGEALTRKSSGLYRPSTRIYQSGDGHIFTAPHYPRGDASSEGQKPWNDRMDWWSGVREGGDFSPYSTMIANPSGSGWIGVDISGLVFSVSRVGAVKARFGPINRRRWEQSCTQCHHETILPPHWWHDGTATAQQFTAEKEYVGTPINALNVSNDLAVDPTNRDIIYIADTFNHRIAKIDFTGSRESFVAKGTGSPVATTYVGGVAGYVDGPIASARFNHPTSLVIDRGVMWIADRENCALRKLDMATGVVSTVAGGNLASGTKPSETIVRPRTRNPDGTYTPWYPAVPAPPQTLSDWILYPQCVRVDSKGVPIVAENLTKAVKAINLASGRVDFIVTSPDQDVSGNNPWTWIAVDKDGLIGPVDDVIDAWISGKGNYYIGRHSRDGVTWNGTFLQGKKDQYGGPQINNEPDFGRHYPWMVAIALDGTVVTTGFGSAGAVILRPKTSSDSFPNDSGAWKAGQQIHRTGTSFPIMNLRPSFANMHGTFGSSSTGIQGFDEAAIWWNGIEHAGGPGACLTYGTQELQRGWGDGIARPEMTGIDAWNYAYFVLRASSVQGWSMPPKPVASGPVPTISNVMLVRNGSDVTVTWETNTPTIGVVRYGRGANPIGRSWDVESAFGTIHTQTVTHCPTTFVLWWITVRDTYGRLAVVQVSG